jgi:hypothetical protein
LSESAFLDDYLQKTWDYFATLAKPQPPKPSHEFSHTELNSRSIQLLNVLDSHLDLDDYLQKKWDQFAAVEPPLPTMILSTFVCPAQNIHMSDPVTSSNPEATLAPVSLASVDTSAPLAILAPVDRAPLDHTDPAAVVAPILPSTSPQPAVFSSISDFSDTREAGQNVVSPPNAWRILSPKVKEPPTPDMTTTSLPDIPPPTSLLPPPHTLRLTQHIRRSARWSSCRSPALKCQGGGISSTSIFKTLFALRRGV